MKRTKRIARIAAYRFARWFDKQHFLVQFPLILGAMYCILGVLLLISNLIY